MLAVRVHNKAVLVLLELAVARVGDRAAMAHAEKPAAIDRHIQRVIRRADISLRELLLNLGDLGTDTDLRSAGARERTRVHIRKLRLRLLEADCTRIGDVVADGFKA